MFEHDNDRYEAASAVDTVDLAERFRDQFKDEITKPEEKKPEEKKPEEAIKEYEKQIAENNAKLDSMPAVVLMEKAYQQEVDKSTRLQADLHNLGYSFFMNYNELGQLYKEVRDPAKLDEWLNDPKNKQVKEALEKNKNWKELKATYHEFLKTNRTLDKFDAEMKDNPKLGKQFDEVRKLQVENTKLDFLKKYEKGKAGTEINEELIDAIRNLAGRKKTEVMKELQEALRKDGISVKYDDDGAVTLSRSWRIPGDPNHTTYGVAVRVPLDKNEKVECYTDGGGPFRQYEKTPCTKKEAAKAMFGPLPDPELYFRRVIDKK